MSVSSFVLLFELNTHTHTHTQSICKKQCVFVEWLKMCKGGRRWDYSTHYKNCILKSSLEEALFTLFLSLCSVQSMPYIPYTTDAGPKSLFFSFNYLTFPEASNFLSCQTIWSILFRLSPEMCITKDITISSCQHLSAPLRKKNKTKQKLMASYRI